MESHEFYEQITNHPHLDWLGVKEDFEDLGDVVVIADRAHDTRRALAVTAVRDNSWEVLESVLTGTRPAQNITLVTRIVGYFSRTKNWNRSKLAELRHRQAGDYAILGPKRKKVMVPGKVGRKSVGAEERIRTSTPEGTGV